MTAQLHDRIRNEVKTLCQGTSESAPTPIAGLSGALHLIQYVNPAFCTLAGEAEEKILGHSFYELPLTGAQCRARLDGVYRTGLPDTPRLSGDVELDASVWAYAMWPILAEDHASAGIVVQVSEPPYVHGEQILINQALVLGAVRQHELTEAAEMLAGRLQAEVEVRKKAEEKLATSEKRYANLYDFAPVGYLTLSSEGSISQINLTATLLLATESEQLLDQRFARFVTARDLDRYYRLLKQVLEEDRSQVCELGIRRSDGTVFEAQLDCVRALEEHDHRPAVRLMIADITARKRAEAEVEHLAFYDPLTQLPNRRLLMDRLQQGLTTCARTHQRGALLFVDLDDFKGLNDNHGHDLGDLVLQQTAIRLSSCVRANDTVARLGGDEFVVMIQTLSHDARDAVAQTTHIGQKLLACLEGPFLAAGQLHRISASVGAVVFGDQQQAPEEVLKSADLALYRAKAAGRNRLVFFNTEMQKEVAVRATLELDLRRALREKQFVLHYQSQVDRNGQVIGVEALVRWEHPAEGVLPPAEFIPFAEESGLIEAIGQWVLEAACIQLVAWASNPKTAHLRVAINVSASEFRHPEFVPHTLTTVNRTGADPRKLMLEFTESVMFAAVEETLIKMTALKEHGISFSIDDFGIGYSSLSYLKNMPLGQIKIDRSFVRDILTDTTDAAIVHSIIALGESLNLEVIAEGVENEAQRSFLTLQGCHFFQGFLFGRPGPAEMISALVD